MDDIDERERWHSVKNDTARKKPEKRQRNNGDHSGLARRCLEKKRASRMFRKVGGAVEVQ